MEKFNFVIPSQTGFSCGDATLLVVEESAQESHPLKRSGWLVDDDILGGSGVKLPTEGKRNVFIFKKATIIIYTFANTNRTCTTLSTTQLA